jgi:hypothetical protein
MENARSLPDIFRTDDFVFVSAIADNPYSSSVLSIVQIAIVPFRVAT